MRRYVKIYETLSKTSNILMKVFKLPTGHANLMEGRYFDLLNVLSVILV